jgi:hypothetical protein
VSSPRRLQLVQGVPAIAEALPGYEFGYWNARLTMPAGPSILNPTVDY